MSKETPNPGQLPSPRPPNGPFGFSIALCSLLVTLVNGPLASIPHFCLSLNNLQVATRLNTYPTKNEGLCELSSQQKGDPEEQA